MADPRYEKLANLLVNHSCRLKKGEKVLIEATTIPTAMLARLIEQVVAVGAVPMVDLKEPQLHRKLFKIEDAGVLEATMRLYGEVEVSRMKKMDAYMGLRGAENITELSDVSKAQMSQYEQHWFKPVHIEERVKNTRWVVLRWPTPSMAQQAGMATEAFEDFYFDVCLADYASMARAVVPLEELMNRTDQVRITGPGTDLRFSIRDIPAVACTGTHNIPDGECFTAPVRDSVEGTISYNAATIYRGKPFDNIRLTFEKGRVVDFSSSDDESLRAILDTDEGARYIGEFAIAFNPHIHRPMRDILFDEKIRGSLHLALGEAYEETENGNRSAVHWDMVLMQDQGGEIYFDDQLIRRDGEFVLPELAGLNPDRLG
ncbi:MAG: aminopeptidase [Vulcanimicrobiota bacterium]